MVAKSQAAKLMNKQIQMQYYTAISRGCDGGSSNIEYALKPKTVPSNDRAKIQTSAYHTSLNEVLAYNPKHFQPKRQNLINHSSKDFDFINYAPQK